MRRRTLPNVIRGPDQDWRHSPPTTWAAVRRLAAIFSRILTDQPTNRATDSALQDHSG
jgi:hypothetical protein